MGWGPAVDPVPFLSPHSPSFPLLDIRTFRHLPRMEFAHYYFPSNDN